MSKLLKRQSPSQKAPRFLRDERGAIKIMFTVAAPFMMLLAGAGFDTAELYRGKINFQSAVDAGTLMAAKTLAATGNTNTALKAGEELFYGNIRNIAADISDANISFDFGSGNCATEPVVATATLRKKVYFTFLRNMFFTKDRPEQGWMVSSGNAPTEDEKMVLMNATAEVECGSDSLEIALVLDNSGSMNGAKLGTLKSASINLVNKLHQKMKGGVRPDPVKFSVVPFSSMVNVGPNNRNASWMDNGGVSSVHHENLNWAEDPTVTKVGDSYRNANGQAMTRFTLYDSMRISWQGCVEMRPYPYHTTDEEPRSSNPDSMYVPSFAPDTPDNWTGDYEQVLATSNGKAICEQFQSATYYQGRKLRTRTKRYCEKWDDGYRYSTHPQDPGYRPQWDDRIEYKRGEYIGSTGNTVTYLQGNSINEETYQNNYLADDHNFPTGSGNPREPQYTGAGTDQHKRQKWTWKYFNNPSPRDVNNNRSSLPSVVGATGGPNTFCESQPLTDLTSSHPEVVSSLGQMNAVGSTNISQGIAWGWRSLSPGEPLTNGRAYSVADNKKIMIVMTDGNNTYYPIDNFYNGYSKMNKSYYSAYAYSATDRIFDGYGAISNPNHDYNTFRQAMDSHMLTTCANVKAAGISIYTIAFDVPNGSSVKTMLNTCASTDAGGSKLYFDAANSKELLDAFDAIAESLADLSLSK